MHQYLVTEKLDVLPKIRENGVCCLSSRRIYNICGNITTLCFVNFRIVEDFFPEYSFIYNYLKMAENGNLITEYGIFMTTHVP